MLVTVFTLFIYFAAPGISLLMAARGSVSGLWTPGTAGV